MFAVFRLKKLVYFVTIALLAATFGAIIYAKPKADVELVVIMYHSVLKDTNRSGKYIVTPNEVEQDIRYLNSHGYTCVLPGDVIAYVYGKGKLPPKPYILTFDDGNYNNLTYILPILERNNAYALISVVGEYSESYSQTNEVNPAYSYLRWCDINELTASGRIEIGNHSYAFHKINCQRTGAKIAIGEDKEQYKKLFEADTERAEKLLYENCGLEPIFYAYPFGAYCEEAEKILAGKGYLMTFICEEGKNKLDKTPECLKLLKRYNRSGKEYTEDFFGKRDIK